MYTVYCDDTLIHDGSSPSDRVHLIDPVLKIADNSAGTFEATLAPTHIGYDICERWTSTIYVKRDGEIIWKGRIVTDSKDFWNRRRISCEGALAFLNDSMQELGYYANRDLRYYITQLIDTHNSKVATNRQILLGNVTVTDNNSDYVYVTEYKSTYEEMKSNFLDRLGGHLRIRYRQADGMPILDYLADYPNTATQEINFGQNLLDFTRNWDVSNLCTVILPKGKALDEENEQGQKEYITIESVNRGSKYLANEDAVALYGRVEKVVDFNDCETPQLLLELGTAYLTAMQFDSMQLVLYAIDLHFLNEDVEGFELLDRVHCISNPHGMDRYFPITEIDMPLDKPDNVKYTLGGSGSPSMSSSNISTAASVNNALRSITPTNTIVNLAKQEMDTLLVNYAHITDGIIDNAIIDHADIDGLSANYAHISSGVIDNAKIDQADVNELSTHYASIDNGMITNAYIDHARVRGLDTDYAHITNGVIDNAKIGYGDVRDLQAHYALIDMSNINNAWIADGIIKDAAITDAMILGVSANKITAGSIDASVIRVYNLSADNITVGTLNGQRIGDGTLDLAKLSDSVYTQAEVDDLLDAMSDRIDGAIETWTGSSIPSLNNSPASSWTTNIDKDNHIGDVYYVVNPSLPENGYAYRFSSLNNTYSWELISDSDVTALLNRLRSVEDKVVVIEQFDNDVTSWRTVTNDTLASMQQAHTALSASVDKAVKSTVQLWYTKTGEAIPAKPGAHVTSTATTNNAWTLSVPEYSNAAPNYFYCYEYEYVDGTYGWSTPVLDRAMSEAQHNAKSGIISSVQLWTVLANNVTPTKPSAESITDPLKDSNSNNINDSDGTPISVSVRYDNWSIEVPSYDSDTPNYFYAWEYHHVDGTTTWSDPVFDQATTDAQKQSANLGQQLNYKVDITTFNEVSQSVEENSAAITRLAEVVDDNNTTVTQSVNNVRQTATLNNAIITNVTRHLGMNDDGTGAVDDVVYRQSALEQTVDGFQTTVQQTYATKQEVDNLVIGGRNLLRLTQEFVGTCLITSDGRQVNDSNDKNIDSSDNSDRYLSYADSGLTNEFYRELAIRELSTVNYGAGEYKEFVVYRNAIGLELNHTYILSFYVKGTGTIDALLRPAYGTESILVKTSQGDSQTNEYGQISITLSTIWTRVWVKWALVSGSSNSANLRNLVLRLYSGNVASVCGMKFEEGTKVTAWTPAPEDSEEYAEKYAEQTISGVIERVSQAESSITQTKEMISLKADVSDTYTINQINGIVDKEVNERTAAINLATDEILSTVSSTYVKESNFNGLSRRVELAESSIEQHNQSIALKADKSTTYTKLDVDGLITTEINNRNSAITTAVDGINLYVSQNYMNMQTLDDVNLGSRNMLQLTQEFQDVYLTDSSNNHILHSNGSIISQDKDGYFTDGESVINGEKYDIFTTRTLNCTSLSSSSYKEFAKYKNVLIPESGKSYVFSFYAKGSGSIHAYFYPNPTGGTCSAITSQGNQNENTDGHVVFELNTTWTRCYVRWTIGGTSNAYRNILLRLYGGSQATVAGLQFESGALLTAWSKSEEEARKEYQDLKQQLIDTRAELKMTSNEINSTVSRKTDNDRIISTINQSAESILISAEKVNIAGAAIFTELGQAPSTGSETLIHGGRIVTGTIDADKIKANSITSDKIAANSITADKITANGLSASVITSGTMSADRISGGTINGNNVNITNLNASNITSGTISAGQISGGTLTGVGLVSSGNNGDISISNGILLFNSTRDFAQIGLYPNSGLEIYGSGLALGCEKLTINGIEGLTTTFMENNHVYMYYNGILCGRT